MYAYHTRREVIERVEERMHETNGVGYGRRDDEQPAWHMTKASYMGHEKKKTMLLR